MALVFMAAGLSKLRHAGISWVLSETMRTTLVKDCSFPLAVQREAACRPRARSGRHADLHPHADGPTFGGFLVWSAIRQRFGVLARHVRLDEMHAVTNTGEILCGFDLYRRLAQVLPLGWIVLPVLAVPGVPHLGQTVYRRVAARRHRTVSPVPE